MEMKFIGLRGKIYTPPSPFSEAPGSPCPRAEPLSWGKGRNWYACPMERTGVCLRMGRVGGMGYLAPRLGTCVPRSEPAWGWERGRWIISMNVPPPEEIPPSRGAPILWDLQTTLYDDWPSTVSGNDMMEVGGRGGRNCPENRSCEE